MVIEKFYCLNLDSRPDRWEESLIEFEKQGLKAERIPGIWGNVNLAYYNAMKIASGKSSLIFEDDVEFISEWKDALNELPEDWDCVFLGANLNKIHKNRYSDHLYIYEDGWAAHAIGYSAKMLEWLLENFDPSCGTIYDEWLRVNVLPKFKCFIVAPLAAVQRANFSDYRNRYVDYTNYFIKEVFR